ncbi:hypothetical protein M6B38_152850 [Iris pallida]|uniref:Uncharacterized protein n=1 Tax=Iris pallida TaxID=29817 RepID=A0AAX6F573_IRIPA|nr:hypothetical protein M6B38_152850 [Iris pallida]
MSVFSLSLSLLTLPLSSKEFSRRSWGSKKGGRRLCSPSWKSPTKEFTGARGCWRSSRSGLSTITCQENVACCRFDRRISLLAGLDLPKSAMIVGVETLQKRRERDDLEEKYRKQEIKKTKRVRNLPRLVAARRSRPGRRGDAAEHAEAR